MMLYIEQRRLHFHRGQAANPIAHVLQAIDEPLDLFEYNSWNVILPEGQFLTEVCHSLSWRPLCLRLNAMEWCSDM